MRKVESARAGQKIWTDTSHDRSTKNSCCSAEESLCGRLNKNVGLSHSISSKRTNGYQ